MLCNGLKNNWEYVERPVNLMVNKKGLMTNLKVTPVVQIKLKFILRMLNEYLPFEMENVKLYVCYNYSEICNIGR